MMARREANVNRVMTTGRAVGALWALAIAASAMACGDDSGGEAPTEECEPGRAECACLPGNECGAGLVCREGVCGGAIERDLAIGDQSVRSCELLLIEQGAARVLDVTFSDALQGVQVRQAPRVSVSFSATSDAPIPAGAIGVVQAEGESGSVEIGRVYCFDAAGEAVAEPAISLGS